MQPSQRWLQQLVDCRWTPFCAQNFKKEQTTLWLQAWSRTAKKPVCSDKLSITAAAYRTAPWHVHSLNICRDVTGADHPQSLEARYTALPGHQSRQAHSQVQHVYKDSARAESHSRYHRRKPNAAVIRPKVGATKAMSALAIHRTHPAHSLLGRRRKAVPQTISKMETEPPRFNPAQPNAIPSVGWYGYLPCSPLVPATPSLSNTTMLSIHPSHTIHHTLFHTLGHS